MKIAQILRESGFELTLLAGTEQALDRDAEGAFLTDLRDPGRFLTPGVVVFSNAQWSTTSSGIAAFTSALDHAKATALVIGLLEIGVVPDELIRRCRELDIPLIVTGDDVAYAAVSAHILHSLESDIAPDTVRELGFVKKLAVRPPGIDRIQDVLSQFSAEFELECWLMDSAGKVVASAGVRDAPAIGDDDAIRAWHAARTGPPQSSDITVSGGRARVWPLLPRDRSNASLLGISHPDPDQLLDPDSLVILTMRGVLEAALAEAGFEAVRAREGVRRLIAGFADASAIELSAHYRSEGADPARPTFVVVAEASDRDLPVDAILMLVAEAFDGLGTILGTTLEGRAVLFVNGPDYLEVDARAGVRRRLEDRQKLLGRSRLTLGISDAVKNVSELPEAFAVATDRLTGVGGSDAGESVVSFGADGTSHTHRSLLALIDSDRLHSFRAALLGPVEDYDARHGSELVRSLRVFLDANGVWLAAADELHVHPNTLRYRMKRVEELTGRSFDSASDRLDFALALAASR